MVKVVGEGAVFLGQFQGKYIMFQVSFRGKHHVYVSFGEQVFFSEDSMIQVYFRSVVGMIQDKPLCFRSVLNSLREVVMFQGKMLCFGSVKGKMRCFGSVLEENLMFWRKTLCFRLVFVVDAIYQWKTTCFRSVSEDDAMLYVSLRGRIQVLVQSLSFRSVLGQFLGNTQ